MKCYILIGIVFISRIGSAGGAVQSASDFDSVMGLGDFGSSGPMSCPECKSNPLPQGFYPTQGMMGGMGVNSQSGQIKIENNKKSIIGSSGSLASKLIQNIPDQNLKNGLTEYLKIVNPDAYGGDDSSVAGSNAGVSQYFSKKFQDNQCFQNKALDFYKDVATILKKENKCEDLKAAFNDDIKELESELMSTGDPWQKKALKDKIKSLKAEKAFLEKEGNGVGGQKDQTYGCFKNRPTLEDHTGKGEKSYIEDGWLLRLAMKHTNGNPEAAFELIGMCGHDDVGQGRYRYFDTSEAAKQKNADQLLRLKEQKKKLDNDLKEAFRNFDSDENKEKIYKLGQQGTFLGNRIKGLSSLTNGRYESLICPPQNSDFFVPGSLSNDADITPELASKIRSIQGGNTQEGRFIPAKHYHVYGSAFLGCKMVKNGMTPTQATIVQKQAARLYRGLRMCDAATNMLEAREQHRKTLGLPNLDDSKDLLAKVTTAWEEKNKGLLNCNFIDLEKKKNEFEKCVILQFFNINDLASGEAAIVEKKVIKGLERADAAKLYKDWYFGGGEIAGVKLPCSDIRYKGPKDLMKPNESFIEKIFKPSGWSNARYEAASKKLATFDMDFEWTVAQHEAGSKFGARLCSESKEKKNPFEEKSCLDKVSQVNPNGPLGFPAVPSMMIPGEK